MLPRFISPIEDAYNKKFKKSPATMFEPTEEMLKKAIETNTPITEAEIIAHLGKTNYDEIKAHLESWYEMEIVWK